MKTFNFFSLCLLALTVTFMSCEKKGPGIDIDNIVEDGIYIKGAASKFDKLNSKGILKATPNEKDGQLRSGFLDIYIALEKGKSFTLVEVAGKNQTEYGPASSFKTVNQENVPDQMTGDLQMGEYQEGGSFTVPESGLYHIVIDKETKKILIIPVTHWAIIGSATPAGWGENEKTKMMPGAFAKDSMTFSVTNVELRAGDFKFRHTGAWKQTVLTEPEVVLNMNYKGTFKELKKDSYILTDLSVGGMDNAQLARDKEGLYTVTATWGVNSGMQFSLVKTGDVEAIPFPENLYINGRDFGGASWEWTNPNIVTMNPVHSHPHAFWAIVYCTAGNEFKFAPKKEWGGDFGVTGEATNGVYAKGNDNVKVTDAGYYMVYVDLKAEKISVTAPEVYLIGKTMNDKWDYAMPEAKFTVDNTAKTLTSPEFLAAGELRMYATCPLSQSDDPKADWWQMEFIVLKDKIEYRGIGGDQERVQVTAGQKVVLDMQAGTGRIQ